MPDQDRTIGKSVLGNPPEPRECALAGRGYGANSTSSVPFSTAVPGTA